MITAQYYAIVFNILLTDSRYRYTNGTCIILYNITTVPSSHASRDSTSGSTCTCKEVFISFHSGVLSRVFCTSGTSILICYCMGIVTIIIILPIWWSLYVKLPSIS